MAKYSEELVEKVVFFIEEEFYTITRICKALGISRQAFYNWMDTKPEFKKEIEIAANHRDEALLTVVHASLKRKLERYITVVEKDIYVPDVNDPSQLVFKSKVITKKECAPDLRTMKMLLERDDRKNPSQPPRREEVGYTPKDSHIIIEEMITDDVEEAVASDEERDVVVSTKEEEGSQVSTEEILDEEEDIEVEAMLEKPDKAGAQKQRIMRRVAIENNRRPIYNLAGKRKKKRK